MFVFRPSRFSFLANENYFFLFNILRLFSFRVVWCNKMYVAKKLFTEQLILYLSTVTEIVCVSRVVCPFFSAVRQ